VPTAPPPTLWDTPPRDLARALFTCARDALLVLDRDRRVVDANAPAAALVGDVPPGTPLHDLLDGAPAGAPLPAGARLRTGTWVELSATAAGPLTVLALRPEQRLADRFRNVVEGSLQGIIIHQDERIRYANPAMARMFGYDGPADLVGRALWDMFAPPEHLDVLRARTAAIYAGEAVPPHPGWCAVGKDGRKVWVSTAASRIEWDGRPAVAAFYLDITEPKRTEDSLRTSERFVHAITGASPLTMYLYDRLEGRNVWSNRHITEDLGYTPDEVRAMGSDFLARLLHPDDLAQVPALLARWDAAQDDEVLETEYRMRHADGSWRWFVAHDTVFARAPDGRVHQFLGTTLDVTARKRAEDALRDSQALYHSLVTNLPISLFTKDRAGRFLFANERFCEAAGVSLHALIGKTDADLWPDELSVAFRADDLWVMDTGRVFEKEEQNRDRTGTPAHVHVIKTPVRGASGEVVGVQGVFWDITARKRAEDERRQTEARLAAVIANSPGMAIQWYDADGRVVLWNRASEEMFGYPAADALGRTLDELIHTPEDFDLFKRTCAEIARTGAPIAPTEYTFRRRNGERGTCISTLFAIPGPAGAHWFVCMDLDITARKRAEDERQRLEAQVRQAHKLESLGVLAGGIAHDFNNLLTSVLGYANLAALDLPAEAPARPMLAEIEKAAQRAAELTQQMLAYSGRGKFVVRAVGLDTLVREMHKLLQSVVSKKAVMHLDLAPATVEADATQLRQVVMNLLTNASDALEGRPGAIAVRTGARALTADELRSPFVQDAPPAGDYAVLEVADSGCGMTEETVARVFDPFFTTKFTGRGLGLAAVLGIVRGHRGSLRIDTAPGRGTTFTVFLPLAPAALEVAAPDPAAPPPRRGSGPVLVVDDEENVRTFVCRVLTDAGYEPLPAGDGAEAQRVLTAHPTTVRAAVVDLTMPRVDGWELAGQLSTAAPGLPVLLMSGYTEAELGRREGRANVAGFIQKPFRAADLLDLLARLAR
jgi:PAS domain S-box-containing protein